MQSIRLTLPVSAADTMLVWPKLRLRLVDIFVKMWLLYAFFLAILPVPVSEKRFLALELVFIFGITLFIYVIYLFFCNFWRKGQKHTLTFQFRQQLYFTYVFQSLGKFK